MLAYFGVSSTISERICLWAARERGLVLLMSDTASVARLGVFRIEAQ